MAFSSIKVGNVDYSVTFQPADLGIRGDGDWIGSVNYASASIKILSGQNQRLKSKCILHEAIHAIVNGYRISALVNEDGKHDEDAIDLIATGMDEVLTSVGIKFEDLFEGSHA